MRLLLVKFGAIGDCVMLLPAAHRMHLAGYTVHWVCGEQVAPLLRLYAWIDVIAVDETALLRGSATARMSFVIKLWRTMATRHYDIAATLYYDRRYRLLTLPVRARRKFMLSHEDRAQRLLPGRHHTDEYFRVLAGIDYADVPRQLSPVPVKGLPQNPLPLQPGKPRVVMVAAGARNLMRDDALRRWPIENYVELARLLLVRGCEVVLCGATSDAWASPAFAGSGVTDMTGKLSLLESLALFDAAALTITHDTGPLHLAGITRCAVLSFFGPTDPHGRLPQRANCVAYWGGEGFACRPCYDGRDYAPCTHNGCIRQVTPAMAFAEAEALLRAIDAGEQLPPRIVTPPHTMADEFVHIAAQRSERATECEAP